MQKIYFLFGDDLLTISNRSNEIINSITSGQNDQFDIQKLEINSSDDVKSFCLEGSNMPFFSNNSILNINLSNKAFKYIQSEIDEGNEHFISLLKSVLTHKTIILTLSIEKYDKTVKQFISNSFIFKQLNECISAEECMKLKFWQIEQIKEKINTIAKKSNLEFEHNALNLFLEAFKEQLDYVEQEIIKLQLYLYPKTYVDENIINQFYLSGFRVDDLFDQIITKNQKSVFLIISQLVKVKPTLYLVAALQNKLRQCLLIKSYVVNKLNKYQISKLTGISSYKLEKDFSRLHNVSLDYLKRVVLFLSKLEYKIKSGSLNDKYALDLFALNT